MNRLKPLFLIIIIFFSCSQSENKENFEDKKFTYESEMGNSVQIILPEEVMTTSDNVLLKFTIKYHQQFIPEMPDWYSLIDSLNILEIKDSPARLNKGDIIIRNIDLLLDNLLPGDYLINPIEFKFHTIDSDIDSVISDYIPIKIESNLLEGENDIIDEMESMNIKNNYGILITFIFLLLGVISFVFYRILRFYKKRKDISLNFHIPYKLQIEQCSADNPVLFYSRLSGIMKEYLDNTLYPGVQSQTTEEIILMCRDSPLIEEWLKEPLFAFLKRAEKNSFNKYELETIQIAGDIQFCLDFISHIDKKTQEVISL